MENKQSIKDKITRKIDNKHNFVAMNPDDLAEVLVDIVEATYEIADVVLANDETVNILNYPMQIGYISSATGLNSGNTDTNWLRTTGFHPTQVGDLFTLHLVGHTAVATIAFYNGSQTFISSFKVASDGFPGNRFNSAVVAPSGAVYFRISFANPLTNSEASGHTNIATQSAANSIYTRLDAVEDLEPRVVTNEANILELNTKTSYTSRRKLKLVSPDKVLLYGDSISSTDYTWYKSSMEALTGVEVYNGGFSGANAAQLASDIYMQRIFDYGAKLVIVMVGGNDSGAAGTVGTFSGQITGEPIVTETSLGVTYNGNTYIQAVSHIIRKFKAQYENIRTRANLNGSETEIEKTAKIDAVLKPVLIFATQIPQNIIDSSDIRSQPSSWERKKQAVIECCNKYKIHCIDLCSKVPFNMSIEPYWTSPTVMNVNKGVYTMDGIHPNKYGYQIMAEIICGELGL